MPTVIQGSQSVESISYDTDFGYVYPEGLNLKPNSELHRKLVSRLNKRIDVSDEKMASRRRSWKDIDRTLNAYISIDEVEQLSKKRDPRKPVSIVFPSSYAILESITSFFDATFLRQTIFKYSGVSPEDTIGAILLEKVVEQHCARFKASLALHTAFKDGLAYGIGAVFPMWKEKWGRRTSIYADEGAGPVRLSEPAMLFEGNALENVDPYLLILDPNVGAQNIQQGEFVGFYRRTSYYELLALDGTESLFNVKYMRTGDFTSKNYRSRRDTSSQTHDKSDKTVLKPIDVAYVYIKVIPKEWGLGEGEKPEKWLFAVAGDRLIIQASPLDLDHDMFPIAICAPTFDGYSSTPLGRLELLDGMQELLNWLFNSHISNVRKTINDMIIYDPYMLNSEDIEKPGPGKLIRARRAAFGKDLRGAVMQLPVQDVTRQHVGDAQLVMGLMNQISGADAATQGSLRTGGPERLSAAEFSGTQRHAMGRLESLIRITSSMFMQDLGYMLAMHTQQFISEDVWVQTTGEWPRQLLAEYGQYLRGDRMKVRPQDLSIDFDVVINGYDARDAASTEFWMQMFEVVAQQPELNQVFDIQRIFRHIASQMGTQNVDNFLRPQIQPIIAQNEQLLNQVAAQDLVPIEEVANALGGGAGGMGEMQGY